MLTFWEHLRIFKFGIDGTVLAGAIPKKQLMQIQSWLKENEEAAYAAWNLAVQGKHFEKIAPLK